MRAQVAAFIAQHDLPELYRAYAWGNDAWESGFWDVLRLEQRLSSHAKSGGVFLDDVRKVAHWGRLRNPGRIAGAEIVLPEGVCVEKDRLQVLAAVNETIEKGIGPTYVSKVLRFSAPTRFGAIDTRCVRVFGACDGALHPWLSLRAVNHGYGWYIPGNQSSWPAGYLKWLNILDTFVSLLDVDCPHPRSFVNAGLRDRGTWCCADVEMALFAYATSCL